MIANGLVITVAVVAALVGASLGARRLAAAAVGTAVAAALVPWAGPPLAELIASQSDWNPWIAAFVGWSAAYVLIAWLAMFAASRILGRGAPAGTPSFSGRAIGALVACTLGGAFAWLAAGNLADLVVNALPADDASPAVAAIRRPFEIVRACRVLATVNGEEAELLIRSPEIRDVLEAESLDRLLRTPGLVRRMTRAADGDWKALGLLAADPDVKAAMNEPELLRRVRAVDVVALAAKLEQWRADPHSADPEATAEALPQLFDDAELREFVLAEVLAEANGDPPIERKPRDPNQPATKEEVEAYWRRVGGLVELFDGPGLPPIFLPGWAPPESPKPERADQAPEAER